MRILLIEDDVSLAAGIRLALKAENYTVDVLNDGAEALAALCSDHQVDAVILDLGLPGVDGMEVLREARRHGQSVPVLILSARDELENRIEGLDRGADDYLSKPFEVSELKARLRALLRRSQGRPGNLLELRSLQLDPVTRAVHHNGVPVALTRREFALLEAFMSNPGRVFTRDTLTQLLYGWDDEVDSNAVEVHIHNLRKKLTPGIVRTVRGIGYVMDYDI